MRIVVRGFTISPIKLRHTCAFLLSPLPLSHSSAFPPCPAFNSYPPPRKGGDGLHSGPSQQRSDLRVQHRKWRGSEPERLQRSNHRRIREYFTLSYTSVGDWSGLMWYSG